MERMRNFKKGVLAVVVFLFLAGTVRADTITVGPGGPGGGYDYATIQEGVDAAVSGADTVVVADGTYTGDGNRDINFLGKAITVRSENGARNCIIDCNGSQAEPHRGFYFHNFEGLDSVVDGFTITNGYGQLEDEGLGIEGAGGGGIRCYQSCPKIINCIFRTNSGGTEGIGGGIFYNRPDLVDNDPEIINCVFQENSGWGGGIHICSTNDGVRITNCTFYDNEEYAISVGYCSVVNVTLRNSIFWKNAGDVETYSIGKCGWPSVNDYYNLLGVIADPCFADPEGGDFHLKSEAGRWDPNSESWVVDANTSIAIDAGDPGSDWSLEPCPNGGRINMGAYGGTAEASKSTLVECFPCEHPDYAEWLARGAPYCWCYPRQCHGDADGEIFMRGKCYHWVSYPELDLFVEGFPEPVDAYVDPATDPWICADFDHDKELRGKMYYYVGYDDLDIFLANWPIMAWDGPEPDCLEVP